MIRIDKFLADLKLGSRSEVKKILKKKRIKVNNNIVMSPELKIDPQNCIVTFDNKVLTYEKNVYYMLNKPEGYVSATIDNTAKTVIDLFKDEPYNDLFPVGRLDKDTVGLLIITNDGVLTHNLLSPRKHIPKTYNVHLDKPLDKEMIRMLENGITLKDGTSCKRAIVKVINSEYTKVYMTIFEGKFHQVKRMFQVFGLKVIFLERIAMGNLMLDSNLERGSYKKLEKKDLELLNSLYDDTQDEN